MCTKGLKLLQYITKIFEKILRKNKILSQPPRTHKLRKESKKKKVLNLKIFKCFMMVQDIQTLIWRVQASQFLRKRKRYVVSFETIFLGSNNIGEFTDCFKRDAMC